MDDKKRKIIIGVLAVALLGAGGTWFMMRDTSDSTERTGKTTGSRRRTKKEKTGTERKARRKTREKVDAVAKTSKRRERKETERKTTTRKKRRRSGGKKVKKEKLVPAA